MRGNATVGISGLNERFERIVATAKGPKGGRSLFLRSRDYLAKWSKQTLIGANIRLFLAVGHRRNEFWKRVARIGYNLDGSTNNLFFP